MVWTSTGIVLAGAQGTSAGASVVLESRNLWWNASTTGVGGCQLVTVGAAAVRALDVVWLKPNCDGDACALYLGDFRHSAHDEHNFSLTNAELATMDTGGYKPCTWGTVSTRTRILRPAWPARRSWA